MDGMLPNLHGYHRERTKSLLYVIICTTVLRSQQDMIKIATTEWFGWLRDVCFL